MTLDLATIRARLARCLAWAPTHEWTQQPTEDLDLLIGEVERLKALAEANEAELIVLKAENEERRDQLAVVAMIRDQLAFLQQQFSIALDPPSIVEAFEELRAAANGAFDGVDADAFVRELRED